ncbi:MAG: polyprenyl diphosphate synthase, partial [Candidatus Diapherotrites archaeon]
MLQSIAFIPDGNRRYAKMAGLSLAESYSLGVQKAWNVLDWLKEYPKIKAGAFYMLSLENLSRTKTELSALYKIFDKELDKVKTSALINEDQIRLHFVGKTELLPKQLQSKLAEVEKYTSEFSGKDVYLALGYNGQQEIADAAAKLAQDVKNGLVSAEHISPETFKKYLYSDLPELDYIVRTSGVERLSAFFTFQSAYSELYFSPKYWPQFEQADLRLAVQEF